MKIISNVVLNPKVKGEFHTALAYYSRVCFEIKKDNQLRDPQNQLKKPHYSTFCRIYNEIKDTYKEDLHRYGKTIAELNKNGVSKVVVAERPLHVIEFDWTPIDLLIVDAETVKSARGCLIYGMDKFSGEPWSFHITFKTQPDAQDWKQCMLHGILPKTYLKELYPDVKNDWVAYGKPEMIVVDNASVNDCREIEDVCRILNIGLKYAPIEAGHHKGTIEQGFRNLALKVIHGIPGTTFSNTVQKAKYDSEGRACVTMNHLLHILHITFVDLIAHTPHRSGLVGTPHDKWIYGLNKFHVYPEIPYNKKFLKLLLATGSGTRKLTPKGIEIQYQHFYSKELMVLYNRLKNEYKSREVRIRFDYADMREIYVEDPYSGDYISAFPTEGSLAMKEINDRYPVHYQQLAFVCYSNNQFIKDFDRSEPGEAYGNIDNLLEKSRKELIAARRKRRKALQDQQVQSALNNHPVHQVMTVDTSITPITNIEDGTSNEQSNKNSYSQSTRVDHSQFNEEVVEHNEQFHIDDDILNDDWGTSRRDGKNYAS